MLPGSASAASRAETLIPSFDHHVAQIGADAQQDRPIFGQSSIGLRHRGLKIDRADHCRDDAGEFHEHAIAGDLEDATAIFGQQRPQDATAPLLQCGQGPHLVLLHESAVSDNVGGHDGGKTTLRTLHELACFGDPSRQRAALHRLGESPMGDFSFCNFRHDTGFFSEARARYPRRHAEQKTLQSFSGSGGVEN